MTNFINSQDFVDIIMIAIFVFLCASILLIILLSFFKERKVYSKKLEEKKEEILEFIDMSEKEFNPTVLNTKEEEVEKIELDIVLAKMKEDLEKKETDIVRTFEQEQEEKAVISYQELLKKNKKEEVMEAFNKIEELDFEKPKDEPKKELEQIKEEYKKFKNSEFISPIYGRVSNEVHYPTISHFSEKKEEKVASINIQKLDSEIEQGEKFLKQLKEFRKNLE